MTSRRVSGMHGTSSARRKSTWWKKSRYLFKNFINSIYFWYDIEVKFQFCSKFPCFTKWCRCKSMTLRWQVCWSESRAAARNKSLPESRNCNVSYSATIMSRASLSHRRTSFARSMRRCPLRRLCPLLPKATRLDPVPALRVSKQSAAVGFKILARNLA